MRFWLVQVGEPLPTDGPEVRVMRTGLLAEVLATRGHEVTWWAADFDHAGKRHRVGATHEQRAPAGYRIVCLHSPGYRRNVGPGRLWDHWMLAREFRRRSAHESRPDAVLCATPTIELAAAATDYGYQHGIPVALDVRDLWPDIFVEPAPASLRQIVRGMLWGYERMLRRALRQASGVIAITQEMVAWALAKIGRTAGPWDQEFPMAYARLSFDPQSLQQSQARWEARGLVGGEFIACYFGTIGRQFDLGTVIQAARIVLAQGLPMRFVLCGDGERRAHFEALAADCPAVMFPGWVGRAEIAALMERSAVGLAPYVDTLNFRLNCPNKVVEYLSGGLPVLASVEGAIGRLLGEHQCGAVYGDAGALAEHLIRLHGDRDTLDRMSRNASALYRQRFVAEDVYGRMADALEQFAAEHVGAP